VFVVDSDAKKRKNLVFGALALALAAANNSIAGLYSARAKCQV
jgi:hypothetical protein